MIGTNNDDMVVKNKRERNRKRQRDRGDVTKGSAVNWFLVMWE